MSKKSTASPLLIRHRYLNPFPPPPFPPKILHIPTDPARYAGYRFLAHLENEREPPVLADAELGMPIELGLEFDGTYGLGTYWEGDQSVVCPDPNKKRVELDPEDAALLVDPVPVAGASVSNINGSGQNPGVSANNSIYTSPMPKSTLLTKTPNPSSSRKTDVTWLRRTEYFNEAQPKPRSDSASAQKARQQVPIAPKTKPERLADIHASFELFAKQPIETLKHPTKPHLKAVETFECLPNQSLWANTCDFYRFQENPTDHKDAAANPIINQVDPRLDHAILRPVPPIHADSRLAYYLPDKTEGALRYRQLKLNTKTVDEGVPDPKPNSNPEEIEQVGDTIFRSPLSDFPCETLISWAYFLDINFQQTHNLHLVREYEVSQQRELNQYLLVFDKGDSGQPRAAYFNPIAQFRTLRKRRPRLQGQLPVDDLGEPLWDGISVSLLDDPDAIAVAKADRDDLLYPVREPPPEL